MSESLVHHLSETLVRLFLAHRAIPPCPWFEIAELKQFWEFKALAADIVDQRNGEVLLQEVLDVFVGSEDSEQALEAAEAVRRLLVRAAERITSDANTYNSVKHGLAVQAGNAGLTLSASGAAMLGVQGPAITFLELEKSDDGTDYYMTTLWTDLRSNLLLAQLLVTAVGALWTVARARYTGAAMTGVDIPTEAGLDSLSASPTRPAVRTFRVKVATSPRSQRTNGRSASRH